MIPPAARFMSAQVLPVGGATPATDCASRGSQAFYTDAASFRGAYRGAPLNQPSLSAAAAPGFCIHLAASEGNSENPTRTGQAPGAAATMPGEILAFVDTWVSAPHRPEPVARDYSFKAVIGEPSW
jgi:hypothetical protein